MWYHHHHLDKNPRQSEGDLRHNSNSVVHTLYFTGISSILSPTIINYRDTIHGVRTSSINRFLLDIKNKAVFLMLQINILLCFGVEVSDTGFSYLRWSHNLTKPCHSLVSYSQRNVLGTR